MNLTDHESFGLGDAGLRTAAKLFPATTGSAPEVRVWLRQQLRWLDLDDTVSEQVQLMVSELASNAIQHTNSSIFEVRLSVGSALEVAVRDEDPSGYVHVRQPEPDDPRGRGLAIVEALSDDWGTRRNGTGKWVWFRLRARSGGHRLS